MRLVAETKRGAEEERGRGESRGRKWEGPQFLKRVDAPGDMPKCSLAGNIGLQCTVVYRQSWTCLIGNHAAI